MTTARAITWPGSFGDPTLPQIPLGFATPTPGALYSWAADTLPLGDLADWADSVQSLPMAPSTAAAVPTVVDSGGGRALRFNGLNNGSEMRAQFALEGGHTILAVWRFHEAPSASDTVFMDYTGPGAGMITVGTDAGNPLAASVDGTPGWLVPLTPIPADTAWHVGILTLNGTGSAFRVDTAERTGSLGVRAREGLALGYARSTPNRTAIEYKRVEVLPAMTSQQRATLAAQMRARYIS